MTAHAHYFFFVGYVLFRAAFVLVSQLRSSHSSGLSRILTGYIITTYFLIKSERGTYLDYTHPGLVAPVMAVL